MQRHVEPEHAVPRGTITDRRFTAPTPTRQADNRLPTDSERSSAGIGLRYRCDNIDAGNASATGSAVAPGIAAGATVARWSHFNIGPVSEILTAPQANEASKHHEFYQKSQTNEVTAFMASVSNIVYRTAGLLTAPGGPSGYLTILLYHRVLPKPDALLPLDFDAAIFDGHMAMLANIFNVFPLTEGLTRLRLGTLPPRSVCITFDDGYRDNLEVACPILKRYKLPATFFIATGFLEGGRMFHDTALEVMRRLPNGEIDLSYFGLGLRQISSIDSRIKVVNELVKEIKYSSLDDRAQFNERLASMVEAQLPDDLMMTPEQVRQLQAQGMEIGGHTHDHPILAKVTREIAWAQILKNREYLRALLGENPIFFAYPNGKPLLDYTEEHVQLVQEAGYESAVSVAFGAAKHNSNPFEMPRIVPWDRSPTRFAIRLLTYALRKIKPSALTQSYSDH